MNVTSLKGVGEKTRKQLQRLEIMTVYDLLHHIPRRYVDYSRVQKTSELKPGPVTLKGVFRSVSQRRTRRGQVLTSAVLDDGHGGCEVVWFNQPFRKAELEKKDEVYLSGELAMHGNRLSIVSPEYESVASVKKNTARIVPVYPLTKGLTSKKLRQLTHKALRETDAVGDFLPAELQEEQGLCGYQQMLENLHFPQSHELLADAKKRWAFNELFTSMLARKLLQEKLHKLTAPAISLNEDELKRFVDGLGFTLTDDQRVAAWEIIQDVCDSRPMNRLLQGDVGSGKTVVSALAIQQMLMSGKQVAVVAPTEIVAKQHADTYAQFFGDEVALLTSSQTAATKRRRKNQLAGKEKLLAVGTHALLQPDVEFAELGLLIIDEQHRFGVRQRQRLIKQKGYVPHVLSMTATPIPRTLSLSLYNDLEISTIRTLPPGRKPVKTAVYGPGKRQHVYDRLSEALIQNQQAYVVCPLIDESDTLGVTSVTREFERIRKYFKKHTVGALHGQLKPDEKAKMIADFVEGSIDILVATTVVEVGVNVPNAIFMLIEGAERFGLAQLHQLRGRVGRADQQAYCYALTSSSAQARKDRLQAFSETTDGFKLAELDLELRGPGAIFGTLQSGLPDFTYADLSDLKQIKRVRAAIKSIISRPRLLQYPLLQKRLTEYSALHHLN